MSSYITLSANIILCPNQPPDFNHAIAEAIKIISSGEVGKRLLEELAKSSIKFLFCQEQKPRQLLTIASMQPSEG